MNKNGKYSSTNEAKPLALFENSFDGESLKRHESSREHSNLSSDYSEDFKINKNSDIYDEELFPNGTVPVMAILENSFEDEENKKSENSKSSADFVEKNSVLSEEKTPVQTPNPYTNPSTSLAILNNVYDEAELEDFKQILNSLGKFDNVTHYIDGAIMPIKNYSFPILNTEALDESVLEDIKQISISSEKVDFDWKANHIMNFEERDSTTTITSNKSEILMEITGTTCEQNQNKSQIKSNGLLKTKSSDFYLQSTDMSSGTSGIPPRTSTPIPIETVNMFKAVLGSGDMVPYPDLKQYWKLRHAIEIRITSAPTPDKFYFRILDEGNSQFVKSSVFTKEMSEFYDENEFQFKFHDQDFPLESWTVACPYISTRSSQRGMN